MSYIEYGDTVTLTMTREEYCNLLMLMGYAVGVAARMNNRISYVQWLRLVNSLNEGNPHFRPYEIPKDRTE